MGMNNIPANAKKTAATAQDQLHFHITNNLYTPRPEQHGIIAHALQRSGLIDHFHSPKMQREVAGSPLHPVVSLGMNVYEITNG